MGFGSGGTQLTAILADFERLTRGGDPKPLKERTKNGQTSDKTWGLDRTNNGARRPSAKFLPSWGGVDVSVVASPISLLQRI